MRTTSILLLALSAAVLISCENQQKIPDAGMGYGTPISEDATPSQTATTSTTAQASTANSANNTDNPKTKTTLPPLQSIDAKTLLPIKKIVGSFAYTKNNDPTRTLNFTSEPTRNGFIQTIDGLRRVYLEWDTQGNLVLKRDDDFKENVRVMYTPGIIVVPVKLEQNEPNITSKSRVQVFNLSDGHPRAAGTINSQLIAIWQSRIETNAGPFDAYIIREKRSLDLDIAQVDLTLDTAYSPGNGEILQMEWRTQKTLDLFIDNTKAKLLREK
ncbi:hypothetical protein KS4_17700 [Poriferisphaera corsica]|uniref:Uncharacterized protein n=1 Tax=Poriferisphaera corsica TaxID=2528020 RepID=A0A517YTZ9_9BACT|nr:hypothetical protein [Poriferisphaera corsica]QDU33714.1 hypothetical protein KS4_17700 [Poriferisphaera corsica]